MTDRNTAIYEAAKSGMPQSEIAKQFGLTQPRICQIIGAMRKQDSAGPRDGLSSQGPQLGPDFTALPHPAVAPLGHADEQGGSFSEG